MAINHSEVDFLIVTALPVEMQAVKELLEEIETKAEDVLGKVLRKGSAMKYDVALTEIGDVGTNAAQAAAREAIIRRRPKRVILVGIAAGFSEAGVKLGDVIVPYAIVPYELAKIKEEATGLYKKLPIWLRHISERTVKYEHRGLPARVSYGLWHVADNLYNSSKWWEAIKEKRPDGTITNPSVHSKSNSILGSGEKIVATECAEARKWLLEEFLKNAMGLEMESYGVFMACYVTDTPFLVVKGSQDPATIGKDIPGEKDAWRVYAAQAAAAFTVALIQRFELQDDVLILEHMKKASEMSQFFERDAPKPLFTYRVSRAESYSQLKEGLYTSQSQNPDVLIPNDAAPFIALHGGGGTGKTQVIRTLFGQILDRGLQPVLLDLRKYVIEGKYPQAGGDPNVNIENILITGSVPRRTSGEIKSFGGNGLKVSQTNARFLSHPRL